MPKRPLKVHVRIPTYHPPRNAWRRLLHTAIANALRDTVIRYLPSDRLEVTVRLYLDGGTLIANDVDNRLKDVLDALQGRAGGSKRLRTLMALVPNDRQVYRVIVEKMQPPKQSLGLGHLVVRRLLPTRKSGGRLTSI